MLSGGLVYFLIKTVYFRERMLAWNEVLESRRFAQRKNMNALAELNTFYRNNIENRSSDFVQEKENIAHIIADCILINCTKLAEILSLLTRHDCHTCIK